MKKHSNYAVQKALESSEEFVMERALEYAATTRDFSAFKELVDLGANLHHVFYISCDIMCVAIMSGNMEILEYLANIKSVKILHTQYIFDHAIYSGHVSSIDFLCKHQIFDRRGIFTAMLKRKEAIAIYMVENNQNNVFDIYDSPDLKGYRTSMLKVAINFGFASIVKSILKNYPVLASEIEACPLQKTAWETALAAQKMNIEVLQLLSDHSFVGANTMLGYMPRDFALYIAVSQASSQPKFKEMIRFLVAYGAKSTGAYCTYITPRDLLLQKNPDYVEDFDKAVLEGKEILEHNKDMLYVTVENLFNWMIGSIPHHIIGIVLKFTPPYYAKKISVYQTALFDAIVSKKPLMIPVDEKAIQEEKINISSVKDEKNFS